MPACAAAHEQEIGVDPMQRDPDGFRWRTRSQIEEERSWLWIEDGVILFKAEASAWTPEAVQLQQVWVDPEVRRRGYGARGLADLCRLLLERVPTVCLFVRAENDAGDPPVRGDRHGARPRLPLAAVLAVESCSSPGTGSPARTATDSRRRRSRARASRARASSRRARSRASSLAPRRSASRMTDASRARRRRSSSRSTAATFRSSSPPELDEIHFGSFDGGPLDDYRAWAAAHPPDEPPPAAARAGRRPPRGSPRAFGSCSRGRRRTSSSSATRSRSGTSSTPRTGSSRGADGARSSTRPVPSRPRRGRAGGGAARGVERRARASGIRARSSRHNGHVSMPARGPRRGDDSPSRPDPAGRRGHLPRLGRRRLDLPLARPRRARLPRLGRPREPRAARRGVGRGRALLRRRAGRRGHRRRSSADAGARGGGAPGRSLRAHRRTRAARDRATRRPTRSRPCSTASSPRAPRRGSSRSARTASSGRCSRSGARRPSAYCEEHGLAYRIDSSNRDTKRGLIRDEILPLLRRLHPGADRNLLALAEERPRLPRGLERTLAELLASTDGTKAADLGGGVRAVREYDDVRLEGRVRFGPWRIESDGRGSSCARVARAIGSRAARRRCRMCSWTRRCREPRATTWPLVVSGDEVVAVPGIAEAPGWEDAVRAWKDPEA